MRRAGAAQKKAAPKILPRAAQDEENPPGGGRGMVSAEGGSLARIITSDPPNSKLGRREAAVSVWKCGFGIQFRYKKELSPL